MYVSQVIMAPLPNIEIVTFLIIIVTRKFGVSALCSVYVFVFCEIFTYGFHIWSINYLYVWAILCLIVLPLRRIDNIFLYTFIAAAFGIIFGTLCSVPYFLTGGVAFGISYIISGLSFDVTHCIGNAVLTFVLYIPISKVINKIKI